MVYIEYSPCTRLGNWLFQYAVAKSLSHDGDVAFYAAPGTGGEWLNDLKRSLNVLRQAHVVENIPDDCVIIRDGDNLDGVEFSDKYNYLMRGVFQLPHLFDAEVVQRNCRVPVEVDAFIRNNYGKMLTRCCVSISVRRGDYLEMPHRHPFVGRSFLKKAVSLFPESSLFVVCSDDIKWCRNFFSFKNFPKNEFLFVENAGTLVDLYMASYCTHNIISNSTFSWWGAYLNPHKGKRVVLPSHWYGLEIGEKESRQNIANISFPGVEVIDNQYEIVVWPKVLFLCLKTQLGKVLRALHIR